MPSRLTVSHISFDDSTRDSGRVVFNDKTSFTFHAYYGQSGRNWYLVNERNKFSFYARGVRAATLNAAIPIP
jgi:hypothetical protein